MINWQPIETAPCDGTSILGYSEMVSAGQQTNHYFVTCRNGKEGRWQYWPEHIFGPTHWAKLEPPVPDHILQKRLEEIDRIFANTLNILNSMGAGNKIA